MNKNNINITFFCGGSGCSSFIKYLENFKDVNINLIINGYDYGKSSGKIRRIFPNMLGPSDFRKNISLLMNDSNILKHRAKNAVYTLMLNHFISGLEAGWQSKRKYSLLPKINFYYSLQYSYGVQGVKISYEW